MPNVAQIAREIARALHGDQRVVRAVLHEHRNGARAVVDRPGHRGRAHREHAGRTHAGRSSGAAYRPSASASPPPCEKPAKIASRAVEAERVALLVDERVERFERGDELRGDVVASPTMSYHM